MWRLDSSGLPMNFIVEHRYENSKRKDVIMYVIVPTSLVRVFFGTAISTSPFNLCKILKLMTSLSVVTLHMYVNHKSQFLVVCHASLLVVTIGTDAVAWPHLHQLVLHVFRCLMAISIHCKIKVGKGGAPPAPSDMIQWSGHAISYIIDLKKGMHASCTQAWYYIGPAEPKMKWSGYVYLVDRVQEHSPLGGLGACSPRKCWKIRCSEIDSGRILRDILGSK